MENRIEKNLSFLLDLQDLDNQLHEVLEIKGELPQEVKNLTDQLGEYEAQVIACQQEQKDLESTISSLRVKMVDIQGVIKRLEGQQSNIRNSREYDAITKEIELHQLDIQLAGKKIREHQEQIEQSKTRGLQVSETITEKKQHLADKQQELKTVLGNNKEENVLQKKYQAIAAELDPTLLQLYQKIRKNVRNNLAVVRVKNGACGGCFTAVYPQMQTEIKEKLRIFRCESCGRILADVAEAITIITSAEEQAPE